MSKIGIAIKIDVTKLDKSRFFKGEKGTYLDLLTFVDSEPDQYGNNGFVTQSQTKEERESGEKMPILGNVKIIFSSDEGKSSSAPVEEDTIPF